MQLAHNEEKEASENLCSEAATEFDYVVKSRIRLPLFIDDTKFEAGSRPNHRSHISCPVDFFLILSFDAYTMTGQILLNQ